MIKTINAFSIEDFDKQVNEFEKTHAVFATQTHVNRELGMAILYTAVIFYRSKDDYNKS